MEELFEETLTLKLERYIDTGAIARERYFNAEGRLHRDNDLPSIIEYDRGTGEAISLHYHQNGKHHRINSPAYQVIDPETGTVTFERWWKNGEIHRDDGLPSSTERDPQTGEITYQDFHCNGEEIRPPINKNPAPVDCDDCGL